MATPLTWLKCNLSLEMRFLSKTFLKQGALYNHSLIKALAHFGYLYLLACRNNATMQK